MLAKIEGLESFRSHDTISQATDDIPSHPAHFRPHRVGSSDTETSRQLRLKKRAVQERAITHNASLFEAEQTMQRAQAEAERARLEQKLVQRDTQLRELREEIRVHLSGDRREIRAHYEARVRTVGTELAEQGSLSRRLEQSLEEAKAAVDSLPPADERDREGMVEREMARRKLAIGQVELERTRARIERRTGLGDRVAAGGVLARSKPTECASRASSAEYSVRSCDRWSGVRLGFALVNSSTRSTAVAMSPWRYASRACTSS